MKVPISWLQEFVDLEGVALDELSDMLTFGGLEIEGVKTVEGETVFEIEVTPNRPDCLSMIGIAREVAALYSKTFRRPDAAPQETGPAIEDLTSVTMQDPCPRYTARVLQGATITPSPDWMQKRLRQCDIRPINNVVDITNYVLLECGQPLHAFDMELLHEQRIVVRRAADGERITTLDDVERPLDHEMLLIADADRGVAVAGVMGGADSEIRDTTKNILLESACFDTTNVRRTSKELGLTSESSYRFERGVDPALADYGSRRAATLLLELAGGTLATGVIDVRGPEPLAVEITCRYQRVRDLIGVDIPDEEIRRILDLLELAPEPDGDDACRVHVPSFRYDLEIEADLIEEVARVHGLRNVPAPSPRAAIVPGADDTPTRAQQRIREVMVGLGLSEAMNYSFLAEALLDRFNENDAARRVRLPNPISQDHAVLRTSLLPQLVENLGRNRARQISEAALFEVGRVFSRDADGTVLEADHVAVGLLGPAGRGAADRVRPVDGQEAFRWIKGIAESLLEAAHAPNFEIAAGEAAWAEPAHAAVIRVGGEPCGALGIVRHAIAETWRVSDPVAALELDLAPLLSRVFEQDAIIPVPPFPPVMRDLAVVVDAAVSHAEVESVIRAAGPDELTGVALFDIYTGKGVGEGRKSLAYSLTYQSSTTTLTDEVANGYHEAIMAAIESKLGAEIRGRQ